MSEARPSNQDEDRGGKLNRELNELLQELRVALPGVEVLFAFLLTVPFTERFSKLTDLQEAVYLGPSCQRPWHRLS